MKKTILFTSLVLTFFISYSQPFKKTDEFKNYLLKNINTIDYLEGIWEISSTMDVGFRDKDPRYKSIQTPSAKGTLAPYTVAIIKMGDNIYKTFPVIEMIDLITVDASPCSTYWFKSTARDGQYIFDNGAPCQYSYHDKAFINSEGELVFSGNFEESEGSVISWNNFSIRATKLSPTASEIRNYKFKY
jgi:hypothetical protein